MNSGLPKIKKEGLCQSQGPNGLVWNSVSMNRRKVVVIGKHENFVLTVF